MKDMKQLLWITGTAAAVTAGLLAASLCLLSSCSQEGSNIPDAIGPVPLSVSTVSMTADGTNPATRALPIPVVSGKLWVGVRAQNGYTAQTGLIYTCADGSWTCPTSVMLGKDPISLYAYYPQDGYSISSGNITLTSQPYSAAKDLCYASSGGDNVCATHPYAGFVLKHAYARVGVDILFSKYFGDAAKLDTVSISAGGIYAKGTQNVQTGVFTPDPGMMPQIELTPGQTMASMGRTYKSYILVVPSATVTNAGLSITVGGKKYKADLSSALTTLEAGKSYRIKAQIDLVGVELAVTNVEVEEWNTGSSYSGETEFE